MDFSPIVRDPSIYTNYVNIHLSIDKLDGTNYNTWASNIKLWLKSQGYVDHLTCPNVDENEISLWLKIDVQLCIMIKSTIDSSLKKKFHTCETCSEVWEQTKLLRLYEVCQDLITVVASKRLNGTMVEYVGKLHALLHDFNELLPPASTPSQELEQRSKFFMLLCLHGLPNDYSHVRDQILGSLAPNFTSTCSTLLHVSDKHTTTDIPPFVDDSSTLVSHHNDRTRPHKPTGRVCHKCDHCGKLGHKIDKCYILHGRPPRYVSSAQTSHVQPSTMDPTSFDTTGQLAIFNKFLKWYENRQNSNPTASVAHSGTSLSSLNHSNLIGPWVIDSNATYHITSNKSFFLFHVYLMLFTICYHGQ